MSLNNLLANIKMFLSSFSIEAALGNLRISVDSPSSSHMYYWACDMRNPGGSFFVELSYSSFNVDDEVFNSYEYSLLGKISEVRVVYLNRGSGIRGQHNWSCQGGFFDHPQVTSGFVVSNTMFRSWFQTWVFWLFRRPSL